MTEISISLSNIQNIKTVNIEGVGIIRARRLGAGEELDLSDKMRRLSKIINELQDIDFTKFDTTKKEDIEEFKKVSKRAEKLSDEVTEIKKFEFNTYKRCFSDDKNGEIVEQIMNTLSQPERDELFKQIFNPPTIVETPELVEAAESEEKAKDE